MRLNRPLPVSWIIIHPIRPFRMIISGHLSPFHDYPVPSWPQDNLISLINKLLGVFMPGLANRIQDLLLLVALSRPRMHEGAHPT